MAIVGGRRLVVTGEADRVVGILSLDDVLELLVQEAGTIGRLLEKQQPRIPT
jgi:CBS domain-containing protein